MMLNVDLLFPFFIFFPLAVANFFNYHVSVDMRCSPAFGHACKAEGQYSRDNGDMHDVREG